MWNFSYAIPTLLVLLIFMGYYFALPRVPVRINRTFIKLVGVEFLVISTDIISTWACIYYENLPGFLLYALNAAYFVAFFIRAYSFFLVTASVLKTQFIYKKYQQGLVLVPLYVLVLVVITSFKTHLFFYFDETGYHSGPLYNTLYLLSILYLALSCWLIYTHKTRVRRKREFSSVSWYNLILFLGLVIRYAFPTYLLMDTFCLMALIIIYLSFENPDFYLEPRTWIFNARALREYVEEINNHQKFTLLEFVVHNFAELRDLYGGKQMDQGIAVIGNEMRNTFREAMIFYCGSGRFVILADHDFDYEKAFEKIKDRFKNQWEADEAELFLDVGGAVIHFGDQPLTYENVMSILMAGFEMASTAENDELIYVDQKVKDRVTEQNSVKRALKYSIEHDQVQVFLQPIFNSKTGKAEGAEALSRIIESDGRIIPPGLFIPIAEKNGMINQIGEIVFEKTCRFVKENDMKAMGLCWINVNLSPIQFIRSDIADRLYFYVQKYGIDPGFIHLEITEETMIDEGLLMKQMEALIDKGFCFVLDDYGKGYSNAGRLKKCPFINIKFDMSIVWDYCQKHDALLPNMVETFKKLGFTVTAEGIEDESMARNMSDIGVNFLQGFYFSKAISMEEFIKTMVK